jgi:uncharacterized protein YraI
MLGMLVVLAGCAGSSELSIGGGDVGEVVVGADETGTVGQELSAGVPVGSTLRTTANLNLRTGPATSNTIRLVIPSGATVTTVNTATPSAGWYNVKYNGVVGWSYGSYLTLVSGGGTSGGGTTGGGTSGGGTTTGRDALVARAQGAVGFSYWWGHGRWIPNGQTSSAIGSCTGSCPSCSHSGSYGADCSGYVGKIWGVPSSNADVTSDAHPYSTVSFNGSNSQWSTVSRGAIQKGDAMVYNSNGAGHIFLFESGDGWGSMWTYEARGCSYGIVHNIRTAGSAYKAIAKN